MTAPPTIEDRLESVRHHGTTVYTWEYLLANLTAGLTGPPIELHLVRHAESTANAKGLVTGQSDAELSLRGYIQALALGVRLRPPYDVAYVSCLARTYKTLQVAESIRFQKLSRSAVWADPRLNERALGKLEGAPKHAIMEYALGDLTYAPEAGESYLELARRLLSFLMDLRQNVRDGMRAVVATHVGPMRLLVGIIEGMDNSRAVLGLKFSNAETYNCVLTDLKWPAFIRREVLPEQYARRMETSQGTSHNPKV
jgi:broad specificity phosphatase PhoE